MTDKRKLKNLSNLSLAITRRAALAGIGTMATAAIAHNSPLPKTAAPSANFVLVSEDGREITIFDWAPRLCAVGTIVFSHGSGSSPDKYARMIEPWVAQGWRVLAPLHVDSREHPDNANYKGLASWKARIEDMRILSAYLGDAHYVAAGHSYGGLVALTLGGAQAIAPEGISGALGDEKVQAVVAFSPPAPIPVLVTSEGYGAVSVPAFIQTGTLDFVPGITADIDDGWKGHLAPFDAAAEGGNRYGLVMEGVNHYFGGAICDFNQPGPPQLPQLDVAVSLSSLFLRGFGLDQDSALKELDSRISSELPVRLLYK